ncbi:MAG: hypothetical protein IT385_27040 [Deltaproteobacteria bacterium]|nr:hypothetical protein [Deltaproteobacteria bacterium]
MVASKAVARLPLALVVALGLAAPTPSRAEPAEADPASPAESALLPNGLASPYPTLRVFRGFGRCLGRGKRPSRHTGTWRSHEHEGLDLGGLGPDGGLGTAVRSITRARVVDVARVTDDPHRYGVPDLRDGEVERDRARYPRRFELAGYGLVHFFTRSRGYWRTGNMVVTLGLDPPLVGHEIRYLHLGAAHPDLAVGDELAPGQELGVLGGTAVQDAAPHLHLDIRDPDGEAVDPAPLLGLAPSAWCGAPRTRALADRRAFTAAAGDHDWRPTTWAPALGRPGLPGRALAPIDLLRTPAPLVAVGLVPAGTRFWHELALVQPCRAALYAEDFASGAYGGHAWRVPAWRGQVFDVDVAFTARDAPATFAVTTDDRLVSPTDLTDPESPVVAERTGERVRIEVRHTTDLFVSVLAPPPAEAATDYRLTITDRCRGPFVKQLSQP